MLIIFFWQKNINWQIDNFDRTKIYGEVITSMFFKEDIHFLKKNNRDYCKLLIKKRRKMLDTLWATEKWLAFKWWDILSSTAKATEK